MSLSNECKEILVVALANRSKANELSTAIEASESSLTSNTAAVALNTAHTASDGKNHSDVVLNNAHRIADGKDHSDVVLNNAHRASDGKNHSDVVLNNAHRIAVGGSIANVKEVTQVVGDSRTNSIDGDYFDIDAQSGNQYRVYLDTTGANATVPAAGGRILTPVDISGVADTAAASADAVAAVLDALADFDAPATGTGTVLITDANFGVVTDAVDPGMNLAWAVTTTVQGSIIGHADVILNNAARNANWKIANIMLATATDNTDAATMAVVVGDYVIEYAQDGGVATACGVIAFNDEFLGDVAEITQVVGDTTLNSVDGDYFDITAKSGNLYRVYLDTTGGNLVVPADAGRTLVRVDISGGAGTAAANADLVAAALAALDGGAEFTAPATGTGTITATDQNTGPVTDAVDPGMANAWAVSTTQQGAAGPNAVGNVLIHYKPI